MKGKPMAKKEQAFEAIKKVNLAPDVLRSSEAIRAAREGLLKFEGDELQAVCDAYAELTVPAFRVVIAQLQLFIDAVEYNRERGSSENT